MRMSIRESWITHIKLRMGQPALRLTLNEASACFWTALLRATIWIASRRPTSTPFRLEVAGNCRGGSGEQSRPIEYEHTALASSPWHRRRPFCNRAAFSAYPTRLKHTDADEHWSLPCTSSVPRRLRRHRIHCWYHDQTRYIVFGRMTDEIARCIQFNWSWSMEGKSKLSRHEEQPVKCRETGFLCYGSIYTAARFIQGL